MAFIRPLSGSIRLRFFGSVHGQRGLDAGGSASRTRLVHFVDPPPVGQEVSLHAERFATFEAPVGFLFCVDSLVSQQDGAVHETSAADGALVGLLPRVDLLMGDEFSRLEEPFPTVGAHVGHLGGVGSPAGVAAFPAAVRIFPGMDPLVVHQVRKQAKALPAHQAAVRFLAGVGPPLMGQEVFWLAEGLPAVRALRGLLSQVDPLVRKKDGTVEEAFPALRAGVGFPSAARPLRRNGKDGGVP